MIGRALYLNLTTQKLSESSVITNNMNKEIKVAASLNSRLALSVKCKNLQWLKENEGEIVLFGRKAEIFPIGIQFECLFFTNIEAITVSIKDRGLEFALNRAAEDMLLEDFSKVLQYYENKRK